jgi:hypothetical protein
MSAMELWRHGNEQEGKRPGRPRPGLFAQINRRQQIQPPTYFPDFGAGVITSSFFCAQAPSPKEVASTATSMIIFTNFNLSRLLSEQVAALF